jgi:hypothetical protein
MAALPTTRRMGRPPLRIEKVTMRLPDGMAERIDAIAGHNKRAAFVRALLLREVARLEALPEAARAAEMRALWAKTPSPPSTR